MKTFFTALCFVLIASGVSFSQTPPDSARPDGPPLPPRPPQMAPTNPPPGAQPQAPRQPAAPQQPDKPAPAAAVKPVPQLPHVAVLDFVSLAGAPARTGRLITERMRYYLLNSGKCTVADGGETWKALGEIGLGRSDSATAEQIMAIGQKLKAGYIVTGLITDYREGDVEFNKHKIELVAKLYDAGTGRITKMERVTKKRGGEVQEMIDLAAEELVNKILKRWQR